MSLFLKKLISFSENVDEVDDNTLELMKNTLVLIGKLAASKAPKPSKNNENDIFCHLNDKNFDFRRYIHCKLCDVSKIIK